jgi:transcriptional regulator with XRE-family HTH domain
MPTTGIRLNGPALKQHREATGISQREMARQLELHPNFVHRMESHAAPVSLSTLAILERYFGVDPDGLELVHPDDRERFRRESVQD